MEDNGMCIYSEAYCPDVQCVEHGFPDTNALRRLREKLTGLRDYPEGVGKVTFHLRSGRTLVVDNVWYEQIGVDVDRAYVSVTLEDESIRHVPFVEFWTVEF